MAHAGSCVETRLCSFFRLCVSEFHAGVSSGL